MADQPIEQFFCRTPKRKRPNHIAMPTMSIVTYANQVPQFDENVESQHHTSPPLPRPPIPPRRHTLAEICRYADEQCAYIEWMTREFEAEEAVRRHSTPSTPAGAITNPFSGPADMWWRPISANDMYDKSALRRQQEEEEMEEEIKARMRHPYLAGNGFPNLIELDSPTVEDTDDSTDLEFEPTNKQINPPCDAQTVDDHAVYAERSKLFLTDQNYDIRSCFGDQHDHGAWLRRGRTLANNRLSSEWRNLDPPARLERDSIILMVPKAILCCLFLPLILTISWCGSTFNLDEDD